MKDKVKEGEQIKLEKRGGLTRVITKIGIFSIATEMVRRFASTGTLFQYIDRHEVNVKRIAEYKKKEQEKMDAILKDKKQKRKEEIEKNIAERGN